MCMVVKYFFFFKQKTSYEMRISDWSSDVCSSDLPVRHAPRGIRAPSPRHRDRPQAPRSSRRRPDAGDLAGDDRMTMRTGLDHLPAVKRRELERVARVLRSEEHTSELQSLMRISYAVFCLKKKNKHNKTKNRRC